LKKFYFLKTRFFPKNLEKYSLRSLIPPTETKKEVYKGGLRRGSPVGRSPQIQNLCADNNDYDQPVTVILLEILSAHKKCIKTTTVAKL
jgi:hypothetical protein